MLARAGSLPNDMARIINGLTHLPFDLMRAIAVLDAPVDDGGSTEGDGVVNYYALIVCGGDDPVLKNGADQMYETLSTGYNFTEITYLGQGNETANINEVKNKTTDVKRKADGDDVVFIYYAAMEHNRMSIPLNLMAEMKPWSWDPGAILLSTRMMR